MNKSGSFLKSVLKNLGYALLAFIIGYPHFVLASYAIPGADDFSCANAVSIYRENHNVLASALAYTRDVYQTWQGTYTGEILMGLEPSVRESFTGIRLILMACVALFIASLIFLIYTVCTKFFKLSSGKAWAAGILSEFIVLNISLTGELFSWYTGAAVYTFPLIAMLFCLGFSIKSYFDQKLVYAILAGVFGVIGAGGSLEVVGFGCAAFLVLLIIYAIGIKNIKKNIKRVLFLGLPFVFTVAGALFNTAAPGNFKRHDAMEASGALDLVPSFTSSWYNLITHIGGLLTAYLLPLVLLIVFVICLCSVSNVVVSGKTLIASVIGSLFITMITIFPVILGYGSYNIDAYVSSTRIIYTFDFVISVTLIVLTAVIAFYVKDLLKRNNINAREQAYKSIILIIGIVIMFSGQLILNYQNGMSMKIIDDLKNDRMQIASRQMTEMYDKVAAAEDGSDVILTEPVLPGTVLYIPLYIDYPEYFANLEVANYYGVNSFSLYWC
jgi:hypothetical protein